MIHEIFGLLDGEKITTLYGGNNRIFFVDQKSSEENDEKNDDTNGNPWEGCIFLGDYNFDLRLCAQAYPGSHCIIILQSFSLHDFVSSAMTEGCTWTVRDLHSGLDCLANKASLYPQYTLTHGLVAVSPTDIADWNNRSTSPGLYRHIPSSDYLDDLSQYGFHSFGEGRMGTDYNTSTTMLCLIPGSMVSQCLPVKQFAKEAGMNVGFLVMPVLLPGVLPQAVINALYQTNHRFIYTDRQYDQAFARYWYEVMKAFDFSVSVIGPQWSAMRSFDYRDQYEEAGFTYQAIIDRLAKKDDWNERISHAQSQQE